jgi:hypothetical protein
MIPAWLRARLGLSPPGLKALGFVLDGPAVMREGPFEPEETALVLALLDAAEVLVNVGANVGYYVCHARRKGLPIHAATL